MSKHSNNFKSAFENFVSLPYKEYQAIIKNIKHLIKLYLWNCQFSLKEVEIAELKFIAILFQFEVCFRVQRTSFLLLYITQHIP